MAKINKEQVAELLKSIHPKEQEDPVDKYTELLKTMSSGSSGNDMLPFIMMLMNDKSGKSTDKLYETIQFKTLMKMLKEDDNTKDDIKELVKEIVDANDKKIEALEKSFSTAITAIKEMLPKPKSQEQEFMEKILEQLAVANKKGDTDEMDKLVKLLTIVQGNKQDKDPLETFGKMYEMVNKGNEKYIQLKEDMLSQANKSTQEQLNQALNIIEQQKNNQDWMEKLRESTTTINKFKDFMEQAGLKPAPAKEGKVDLKYILDTVSDVVKNIAPAIPAPRPNPSWDIEKEAKRLYSKYKDILKQEDGSPLSTDFIKQELQKNPNVENIWKMQIDEAMKSLPVETTEEQKGKIDELLKSLKEQHEQSKEPKTEPKEETKEETNADITPETAPAEVTAEATEESNKEVKGKFVKGIQ
jgi:hypothetical protein